MLPENKCKWCGKTLDQYNADPKKAAYERKWNVHWECREAIESILDRNTIMTNAGSKRTR